MNRFRTLFAAAVATSVFAVVGCSSQKTIEEPAPVATVTPPVQEPVADTSSMPSHPALPAETVAAAPAEPAPEAAAPVVEASPPVQTNYPEYTETELAPKADRN